MAVLTAPPTCLSGSPASLWIVALSTAATVAAAQGKLPVAQSGLCSVEAADLAQAGVPLRDLSARQLSMSCAGQPVAIGLSGPGDATLSETSSITFYGEALNTRYTGTNVYWLEWAGEPAPSMAVAETRAARSLVEEATVDLRFEENHLLGKFIFAPETAEFDHWMWVHSSPGKPAEASVQLPVTPLPGSLVHFRAAMRGRMAVEADPDHHTVVEVAGQLLEDARWDGQVVHVAEGDIPSDRMPAQDVPITITCPGDTDAGDVDSAALDYIEVRYTVRPAVPPDQVVLRVVAGAAHSALVVLGGDAPLEAAYDVTEPRMPVMLPVVEDTGRWLVHLVGEGERQVLLVREGGARRVQPSSVPERVPLTELPSADYLIIAHPSLTPALGELIAHREAGGLAVAVAPVDQIYDEYGWGLPTPEAIRSFVAEWYERAPAEHKPRFLLLVGDANYDYRDYTGTGIPDLVPAMLIQRIHRII